MNETMKHYALGMLLKQINESEFDKIEVSKVDRGVCVRMAGQTYGIIGALGADVADVSKSSDIPVEDVIAFVGMAAELATMGESEVVENKQFESREQMLDFVKDIFNKKGDK